MFVCTIASISLVQTLVTVHQTNIATMETVRMNAIIVTARQDDTVVVLQVSVKT